MLYKKKLDYNFKFNEANNLVRMSVLKLKKYENFFKKIDVFFLFRNIVDINELYIQRYILMLWLCFGKSSTVLTLKKVLRLGVRYVTFCIGFSLKKKSLEFLNFFIERFLKIVKKQKITINSNNILIRLNDLSYFTGLKLAPGIFFVRLLYPLYIRLHFNFTKYMYIFLSFFKVNVKE